MNQISRLFSKHVTVTDEPVCLNAKMTLLQQGEKENFNPQIKVTIQKNLKRPLPVTEQCYEPRICKKITNVDTLQLFSVRNKKYTKFLCYNDSEVFPQKFQKNTIEKKSDDDVDSDTELVVLSQKFVLKELLSAMALENNQSLFKCVIQQ